MATIPVDNAPAPYRADPATNASAANCRVMFYSVGQSGLGQTVRAMRLARYLHQALGRQVEILVVTGVAYGDRLFQSAHSTVIAPSDIIRLTEAVGSAAGVQQISTLRASATRTLKYLASSFAPDIFVSTSHRGVAGEMESVANSLRSRHCRMVLALRDIYYPALHEGDYQSMSSDDFDVVLIGGPPDVRDWAPAGLLGRPLAPAASFTGYLRPLGVPRLRPSEPNEMCTIRVQVGGGRDGAIVALAVITAVDRLRPHMDRRVSLEIATGPLMSDRHVRSLRAAASTGTHISRWLRTERSSALDRAGLVVSMAGYNSCVEAGWSGTPTILVARNSLSDQEQLIRARLFSRWFSNIDFAGTRDDEDLPERLAAAISIRICRPAAAASHATDYLFAIPPVVAHSLVGTDQSLTNSSVSDSHEGGT